MSPLPEPKRLRKLVRHYDDLSTLSATTCLIIAHLMPFCKQPYEQANLSADNLTSNTILGHIYHTGKVLAYRNLGLNIVAWLDLQQEQAFGNCHRQQALDPRASGDCHRQQAFGDCHRAMAEVLLCLALVLLPVALSSCTLSCAVANPSAGIPESNMPGYHTDYTGRCQAFHSLDCHKQVQEGRRAWRPALRC